MVSSEKIDEAVRILVDAAHPLRIILFGSYARGDAREDSDVDLLVIEEHTPDKAAEMVRLRRTLRPLRIPVDLLIASKSEIELWRDLPGTVLYWALKEGQVRHESAH